MKQTKIGITGGIGSGKSVVSHILRNCGVPVYDCDSESKRLTNTDSVIREELTRLLGSDVYAGGQLNKPLLASYIFGSDQHVRTVNAIIHPRVRADIGRWAMQHQDCRLLGVESAIFFEADFTDVVDNIVMVYAPEEVRVRRVMTRDGASETAVMQRMDRQMSDEEKMHRCSYHILNDGKAALMPQVLALIAGL